MTSQDGALPARGSSNRWLSRYAKLVAGATFFLVTAGALVTSNDAGLSVPDWPTSFGTFRMPRMVGGVKYEHGHRMVAGVVGLLTIGLALWLVKSESRPWVRKLGGIAVLTIFAQALLGGITVLYYLPVGVSVGHAALAHVFVCVVVSLALFTSRDWRWDSPKIVDPGTPSLRKLSAATSAAVFFQLILGAAFRHNAFGITPHIAGALVVTVAALWVLVRVLSLPPRHGQLRRAALLLFGLVVIQIFLGLGAYLIKLDARGAPQPLPALVAATTAHVVLGALVLAASVVVTLKAWRFVKPEQEARQMAPAPQDATT